MTESIESRLKAQKDNFLQEPATIKYHAFNKWYKEFLECYNKLKDYENELDQQWFERAEKWREYLKMNKKKFKKECKKKLIFCDCDC